MSASINLNRYSSQISSHTMYSRNLHSQRAPWLLWALVIFAVELEIGLAATQNMIKHEPMFVTRSETFKFVSGETIHLPCEVSNADNYVVAWKRGIAILSAGSVKVTPDPRVHLVNGYSLQIKNAVPQDAGDYVCQIATLEPREITHTVEILVPPRIHHVSSGGHRQVKKGESVRIECSASGNPSPNITWTRKFENLPNGDEKLSSSVLLIENMDRHKGGTYICTANNGVGQAASAQVVLHVLYPPEITVETPVVFSGEDQEALLVCIVHGEAQPDVIWFKETMQLDTTERHIMGKKGSRHTLMIRKVHPQDFGNYSCVAENPLGKTRKTLQLTGKPNTAQFRSLPTSQFKDRYNISWTVDSHTPIDEFKLFYRRLPQGHDIDNSIDQQQPLQHHSNLPHRNYNMHWSRSGTEWRDVVLPSVPLSHHYTQGMSYLIKNLDQDQQYEARVQSRNRYGWSDMSESFTFSTTMNDNDLRGIAVTYYGTNSQSINTNTVPLILPIAMFILKIFV
ncbi:limbic system-associated membrane protein isoform X2 [Contarinia nasturtii]|uniref:limbic system-associated membrane protein isoform X2 n=1 Tax=Contarinia nasturtii TaxID=265458 RepID=UPI0012D4A9B3|nr:limbic system-associated membrane protein isoform X2 [Contarinia nasturtii]